MTEQEIYQKLNEKFSSEIIEFNSAVIQPFILLKPQKLEEICTYLRDHEQFKFDLLMNLSGVDYPEDLEVVYHLNSLSLRHKITLKVRVRKTTPQVPSVSMVWRTADWHEREAYDLLGIEFTGHPDLRRILLPEDWEGFPLRKDYVTPEYYNGLKVPYPAEKGELFDE